MKAPVGEQNVKREIQKRRRRWALPAHYKKNQIFTIVDNFSWR